MNEYLAIALIKSGENLYLDFPKNKITVAGDMLIAPNGTEPFTGDVDKLFVWYTKDEVISKLVQEDISSIMRMGAEDDYSYLSSVLTGDGFKQYNNCTDRELNEEWQERAVFAIEEGRSYGE